ncbi:uncharacterized protein LOC131018777 [Salvia miltiorrhiza]|uniref:uncharacterized protein LOC131018777 n=1 Tax=Salvia miltiorrhiza TaxID=226208 RepID=UPI0025AD8310|nr:uncharacterized protein LOC131018777 [Salvia miltiorrhiza]
MDLSSVSARPPTLDSGGKNYNLWKTRMKIYIKSIDERAWVAVLDGWTPPRTTDENGVTSLTPESKWSADERLISNHNSRALNAIFISVDVPAFRMISNCTEARDAWLILQEQCEGSASVRATKMRMLTTKFEILRMRDDETFSAYYEKLCEISNEAVGLGEPISNERLVSKILRSLPERYNMKISSIEETADVATLRVGDLVSKLLTFEMNLEQQKADHVSKSVAFRVEKIPENSEITNLSECTDVDPEEEDDVNLAMLVKNFNNMLKSFKKGKSKNGFRKPSGMSAGSSSNITNVKKNIGTTSEVRSVDHIQCRGCQGMGHYANECPTVARKRHSGLTATLSDDSDSEEEKVLLMATVDEEHLQGEDMIGALKNLDDEMIYSDCSSESGTLSVDDNISRSDCDVDLIDVSDNMNVDVDVANTDVNISSENDQFDVIFNNDVFDMDTDVQEIDGTKIPTNTTNWYEMTILDDFNSSIPDFCCVTALEEQESDPLKEMENFKELYEVVDSQCRELRNDICMLVDENQNLKGQITRLERMLSQRDVELDILRGKVCDSERVFKRFNKGTSCLNEVLSHGQHSNSGIGFCAEEQRKQHRNTTVFVKERNVSVNVDNIKDPHKKSKKKKSYVCHYCFAPGHIKPHCVKYISDCAVKSVTQMFDCYQKNVSNTGRFDFSRLLDKREQNETCNTVVYTSLNANISENWYFDSGCSRHMTGTKALLSDFVPTSGGKVTFGGGAKGTILGKGVLNVTDFPKLKYVYLVEGLKANLFSISQLCDAGMTVKFNKHLCEVFDDTNQCVMMGKRSSDNCYKSQEETFCNAVKLDDVEL